MIPLSSPAEGMDRFTCAQAGCPICMQHLLEENTGLVWSASSSARPGHLNIDDLFQEGRIALWQAILHFDSTRGTAFSSYACAAIRDWLWLAVKRSLESIGESIGWLPWEEEMDSLADGAGSPGIGRIAGDPAGTITADPDA